MGRSQLFDSLKFGLICLMVFGHTIQSDTSHISETIFGFIYTFHMPLFIFISGYFSKNMTWEKYKRSFISLTITFTIFQFIYSFPFMFVGLKEWFIFFIQPKGWYIVGLLAWRFLFLLAKNRVSKTVLLLISFILPLLGGFLDYGIPMFRILTFFPYFVLGVFCPESLFYKIRNIKKVYTISILASILIFVYLFVDPSLKFSFFGEGSFGLYTSKLKGFLYAVQAYALAIIASIGVINLMPDTIGKYGSKTLEIYLLHHVVLNIFYMGVLPILNIEPGLLLGVVLSVVIVAICLYLSRFKIVEYIMSPLTYLEKKNIKF